MRSSTVLFVGFAAAACVGKGAANGKIGTSFQPLPNAAALTTPSGNALTEPDWFKVDHKARTVTMKIVAEQSGGLWTFNGHSNGNATIVVPEGYKVTITFSNEDMMAHSIGVLALPAGKWPAMPSSTPVFPGAITSDPTSTTGATGQGNSETITFTASKAGHYALLCFIPSHAVSRMWIKFDVVAGTEAGVRDGSAQ